MRKLSATSCAQCQTIPFVTEVAKGIHTIIAPPHCLDKFLRQQTAVPTRNFTLPTTHRTTTRRWEGSVRTLQVSEKNSWFSYAAQRESEADHARCARQRRAAGREQQFTARPLTTTSHRTQHTVVPKAHRKTISQMSTPKSTAEDTCVEPQQKIVSASVPRGGVLHTYHRQRHLFPFQRHLRISIQNMLFHTNTLMERHVRGVAGTTCPQPSSPTRIGRMATLRIQWRTREMRTARFTQ